MTGPRPSEKVNMNMHSQTRVTPVPQPAMKALPTIARLNVTITLLTKNRGRRPILFPRQRVEGAREGGTGEGRRVQGSTSKMMETLVELLDSEAKEISILPARETCSGEVS